MANMSYCRFRNTLEDLQDCFLNMDEEPQSTDEKKAKGDLIALCGDVWKDYGEEEE